MVKENTTQLNPAATNENQPEEAHEGAGQRVGAPCETHKSTEVKQ